MLYLQQIFRKFLAQMLKFAFWVGACILPIRSKYFMGLVGTFLCPNIFSFMPFGNS